jgi:hypothetical protein
MSSKQAAFTPSVQTPWALWQSYLNNLTQMATGGKGPLSGDVTQAINPWSWVFGTGQFGFININLGNSGDPKIEQEVLDEVGSYGRQLGRIGDALAVLIKHADKKALDPLELDALTKLRFQLEAIDEIKKQKG